MKKAFALIITLCMTLALASCGTQSNDPSLISEGIPTASGNTGESNQMNTPLFGTETPDAGTPNEESNIPEENTGSKVLVAYFSCTGNTQGLAEKIASALDADLYEIVPEEPYTDADLDYNNSSSRSTKEQNDDSCRPAISGSMDNIDNYDTVIIGYPIWWGQAPKIISTFLESYNFNGKTIIPFCTSGSSGIGSSATNLHILTSGAAWFDGQRFSGNTSRSTVENWVNGLGLTLTLAA